MRLLLGADVKAEMAQLPPGPRSALKAALQALSIHDGDRPPGLDVKRLRAGFPVFRARVGAYRIVYSREGQAHRIHRVFHRSEGYGWLERLG